MSLNELENILNFENRKEKLYSLLVADNSNKMVCVPCIILPVLLAIYLKFIQPLIMRFVPDSWKAKVDAVLYPTCPVSIPKPASSTELTDEKGVKNETAATTNAEAENKKYE